MKHIEFIDTCVITRKAGVDSWDNPILNQVYSGNCLYQEGGASYADAMVTKAPTLYLPSNSVLVEINDEVAITTASGRVVNSRVKVVRDVRLRMQSSIDITRIELKQTLGE